MNDMDDGPRLTDEELRECRAVEIDIQERWKRRADELGCSMLSIPEKDFELFMAEQRRRTKHLRDAADTRWRAEQDRKHKRFSKECEEAFFLFMAKATAVLAVMAFGIHYLATH